MPALFTTPIFQALDDNGNPLSGAKLYFYEAGTTTPRDVYSDTGLSTAISQPVVADSAGRFEDIYMAADDYKAVLQNSSSVEIWTQDNYTPPAPGSTNLLNGIATQAAARAAIAAGAATDVSANTTSLADIEAQIAGIPGAALGNMAGEDDVGVDNLAVGFGVVCVQRLYYTNSASTSIATIPDDGTAPQSTEGTSVFDEDITPTVSTSKIIVRGIINLQASSENASVVAVFLNGATSAQRAFTVRQSRDVTIPFECEFEPGSTSQMNVLIRAGKDSSTVLLNSSNSFGSASVSSLVIEEWRTI